jgi:chromosome segregation ATPase
MLADAFQEIVVGLSRFKAAISDLEKELKNTQDTVLSLQERLRYLENTQDHHRDVLENLTAAGLPKSESDIESMIETMVDDRVDAVFDMRIDDAIESAMSGREVEINFNGTVTL